LASCQNVSLGKYHQRQYIHSANQRIKNIQEKGHQVAILRPWLQSYSNIAHQKAPTMVEVDEIES
jgi:hypothetical protein